MQPAPPGRAQTPPRPAATGGAKRVNRPVYNLEKFTGKTNLSEWEAEFSRACVINGWNRQNSSLMLPTYFEGRARDFYLTLDIDTRASAARTLDAMHKHFESAAIKYQAKTQAAERGQKQGESVSDYFTALSNLTRKAFAHLGKETERDRLKEMFVKGLRPALRKIFWSNEPANIEAALLLAENRESYLRTKKKMGLDVNMVELPGGPTAQPMAQPQKREDKWGGIATQLADMQIKFNSFREEMNKELVKRDTQMNEIKGLLRNLESSTKSNYAPKPAVRGPLTCWGCGKAGHMRSLCPELGKKQ